MSHDDYAAATDEPILSDAEADALLEAMREDEWSPAPAPRAELASPERTLTQSLTHADRACAALAHVARAHMLKQASRAAALEALPSEIRPYETIAATAEPSTLRYALTRRDARIGTLWLAPRLARALLEQALGAGPGEAPLGPPRFSALDRRILAPFPAALAAEVGRVLLSGAELRAVELPDDRDEPVARFEPVLRLALRSEPHGDVTIALSAAAFVPAPAPDPAAALGRQLREATVAATAILGRARITVRELLALQHGDVVRLHTRPDLPIDLCVGEVVHARGVPVAHHGNHALELTEHR